MVGYKMDGDEPIVSSKQQVRNAGTADLILRGVKIDDFEPECAQYPEVFFPTDEDDDNRDAAKEVCGRCEIREACLEAALVLEAGRAASGRYGIWGGLDERERESLARKRRRKARAEEAQDG